MVLRSSRFFGRLAALVAILILPSTAVFAHEGHAGEPHNHAWASIDLDSLSISVLDLSGEFPSITPVDISLSEDGLNFETSAKLSNDILPDGSIGSTLFSDSNPMFSQIPLFEHAPGITASASANANLTGPLLNTHAALESNVLARVTTDSSIFGSYTVPDEINAGTLFISLNYELVAEVSDAALYSAAAGAGITVGKEGESGTSTNFFDATANLFTNSENDDVSDAGRLTLALAFEPGDVLNFAAFTFSDVDASAVPLPASLWLFGSGLAMVFMRKNKQR